MTDHPTPMTATDQPTEAPDAAARIVQRRDNWSRETVRSLRRKLRNVKAEMGRHDAGRARGRGWFWGQIKQLREQISLLTVERDQVRAALHAAERREVGLQKSIRRIVSFMEDAPELWGNPAADRVLGRLRGALAAPDRADQEGADGRIMSPKYDHEVIFEASMTIDVDDLPELESTIRHCQHADQEGSKGE